MDMDNNQAGSVGVFFTATIDEAIRIHGVPVQRQLTSSINVVYVFSNLTIFYYSTYSALKQN